jgi:tetratricopeptide (TPR) repeat protein
MIVAVQNRLTVLTVRLIVALLLLLAGGVARAQSRTEKAREHYLQGDAYYKLDKYREALQEYEQAYIIKSDPSFLYNIAQCHRLMGDKLEALKFYRRYLKDAPEAPNRAVAEKHVKDLETALSRIPEPNDEPAHAGSATPSGARSGAQAASPPPPAPLPAPASSPTSPEPPTPVPATSADKLALNAPPPPTTEAPGSAATTLSNEPAQQQQQQEKENRPAIYTRWWFWTAVGAAVVGGVLIGIAASGHDPACPAGSMCK